MLILYISIFIKIIFALDIEQGRFRDAAEVHKEEKEKIQERHDIDMETDVLQVFFPMRRFLK